MFLKRFDIGIKFVESSDPAAFAAAIDEKTKAIYVESIGNPKYNVAALPELAKVLPPRTLPPQLYARVDTKYIRSRTTPAFH